MPAWLRSMIPGALATALLAPRPAAAESPAEQAERLNQEGKQLFAKKDYEGAHRKFREAATLSPEGRFYFNICYALNFLERYQEAIEACEQVEPAGADAALIDKTRKALDSLREKAASQSSEGLQGGTPGTGETGGEPPGETGETGETGGVTPGETGGPTQPAPRAHGASYPGPGRPGGPRRGPAGPDPFLTGNASGPTDSYKWSVGGTFGVLGNVNVGREVGPNEDELYAPGGAEIRLFANFILSEAARLGLQASMGIGALAPGNDNTDEKNLLLYDLGGALFLHLPLGKHIFVTPLAGPQLAIQQPEELSQGFLSFGVHGELGLSYVFGRRGEHALSLIPAVNVYFPAAEADGNDPADFGLDVNRTTFAVSAGYTFRFSTPFGSVPLITLE